MLAHAGQTLTLLILLLNGSGGLFALHHHAEHEDHHGCGHGAHTCSGHHHHHDQTPASDEEESSSDETPGHEHDCALCELLTGTTAAPTIFVAAAPAPSFVEQLWTPTRLAPALAAVGTVRSRGPPVG